MKEKKDLISIILPVYNGEQFVAEAIESCLSQTHKNFELIIVNDCSTDSSLKIAQDYASQDERVRVFTNEENLRLPASLNVGHEEAKGTYITWTSDDNRFRKSALEQLLTHIKSNKVDLAYAHCDVIDVEGKVTGFLNAKDPSYLLFENVVGACFLYSKEIYDRIGPYNPALALIEDYDFWLRVAKAGRIKELGQTLYEYRQHVDSLTTQINDDKKTQEAFGLRKRAMFERQLPKGRIEDSDIIIDFLASAKRDSTMVEELIKHPKFFRGFKLYAASFKGIQTEKVIENTIVWFAEMILRNPELQKLSVLTYLYKHSKGAIRILPLKRQAALAKKCL